MTEPSNYELMKQADEFLKEHGCVWNGEDKKDLDYQQNQFERRMQTGAYSGRRK
ncbi:MAG TPA: hypothetical protein QGG70_04110 [Candidatus Pacearchaeota archaeon]|jgi:hypothetical protein|nr:hypothetical protein [Candidatus Pacearchaeota archaeon]|tara:strand:- start:7075 stop:7236 length:162 start_codon:yes stop_codon:yes gene_type:complete